MRTIGRVILKGRFFFLAAIIALTVVFALALDSLETRDDESTWMSEDNQARVEYDHFKELFGFERFIVVAYETPDPFIEEEIEYLSYLTDSLAELPRIEDSVSLSSLEETVFTSAGCFSREFLRPSDAPRTEAQRCSLDSRIEDNPFVEGTLISGDRRTVGIVLELEGSLSSEVYSEITHALEQKLDQEHSQTGRFFYYGGAPVSDTIVNDILGRDISLFVPLTLLISSIMLFLLFRSWQCVVLPLLSVILGMVWTFGLKALTGSPITPVSTTLIALITIIGVANSIHFISHYRIELARNDSREKAMLETFALAGTPCFLTALTTAVGFGSLVVSNIPLIRHLGAFAAFGIMSTFALTMVLLPVGLQGATIRHDHTQHRSRTWATFGRFAIEHARVLLVLCTLFSVAIALGGLRIQIEPSMTEYLKPGSPARQAADFFDARLSGSSSIELLIEGPPDSFETTEFIRTLDHLQSSIENHAYVAQSYSIVDYVKSVNGGGLPQSDVQVRRALSILERADGIDLEEYYVQGNVDSTRVSIRTKQMRLPERNAVIANIEQFADQNLQGFELTVTGADGLLDNITVDIVNTQIYSLMIAVLVILGMMLVFFGPRGALAAILPNAIPIALLFGFMGLAGFELNIATITVAAICMGLVVDDTIHYFAHFRRLVLKTGDRKVAAQEALNEVGSALAFTTLTLVLGFSVFMLSESAFLMQFGFLAIGALLVAFTADITVSPAILSNFDVFKPATRAKRNSTPQD